MLMVSDRGRREYFTTGFSTTKELFDDSKDGGRFFQGRGIHAFNVDRKEENGSIKRYSNKEANDILSEMENRALGLYHNYIRARKEWSLDIFRQDFLNIRKQQSFLTYAQSVIDQEYLKQNRYKKAKIAKGALESMLDYDKNLPKKDIVDVTDAYIQGYIKYCKGKGNTNNTIGIRLREIRRIFNIAIRDKVISAESYPFSRGHEDGKVKIPKAELSKTDQYISVDNLKKMANTPIANHVLERTRHLFLFSYYCKGMNWKDMALLRKQNFRKVTRTNPDTKKVEEVTAMQYKRSKTKGDFDILVSPSIERELKWFSDNTVLFEDYVLPIIKVKVDEASLDDYLQQIRKRFNRSLKMIAKELGFPESQQDISIYTARHSYAMTLQDKGTAIEYISQALGHESVNTTKHYLSKFDIYKIAEQTDIDLSD